MCMTDLILTDTHTCHAMEKPEIFAFEQEFLEDNIRCIPMAVRFKLDACGIKLKLAEWCRMRVSERALLMEMPCASAGEIAGYRGFLCDLVRLRTGNIATDLAVDPAPAWSIVDSVPDIINARMAEFNWSISLRQWQQMTALKRFVLIKLCKPGHEHKNFPKAVKEFHLA